MSLYNLIEERVSVLHGQDDLNCVMVTLLILAEVFEIDLHPQVLDVAVGMESEGRYSSQCGLLGGCLMFIGIYGRKSGMHDKVISEACDSCASKFEAKFGSIKCIKLRSEHVPAENFSQRHEPLTRHGIEFAVTFIKSLKG